MGLCIVAVYIEGSIITEKESMFKLEREMMTKLLSPFIRAYASAHDDVAICIANSRARGGLNKMVQPSPS